MMRGISEFRADGFSLLEVLISVGVLSIALLGTAGLMATSLRNTNTAYYRSQATILADDILDRMRANRQVALAQNYDIDPYTIEDGPSFKSSTTGVALYDCTEWTETLAGSLPGGVGRIDVDTNGTATITILWTRAAAADPEEPDEVDSFTTVSQL